VPTAPGFFGSCFKEFKKQIATAICNLHVHSIAELENHRNKKKTMKHCAYPHYCAANSPWVIWIVFVRIQKTSRNFATCMLTVLRSLRIIETRGKEIETLCISLLLWCQQPPGSLETFLKVGKKYIYTQSYIFFSAVPTYHVSVWCQQPMVFSLYFCCEKSCDLNAFKSLHIL